MRELEFLYEQCSASVGVAGAIITETVFLENWYARGNLFALCNKYMVIFFWHLARPSPQHR